MIADTPLTPQQIAALGSALEAAIQEDGPDGRRPAPHRLAFAWDKLDGCTPLLMCALRTEQVCLRWLLHPTVVIMAISPRALAEYLLASKAHEQYDGAWCTSPFDPTCPCPFTLRDGHVAR